MSLSAKQVRGLANTMGMDGAKQVAQAVAESGTPGVVNSSGGALQLGTNTTDAISIVGLTAGTTSVGLTAHAGGTQAAGLQLTAQMNQVSTVATAADSVLLPAAALGRKIVVVNDGANSMQVFGQGTDTINSVATATGVPQAAGSVVTYECVKAAPGGNWRTGTSNGAPVSGVAAGYKIARGEHTQVAASDTIVSGLTTVVAVVVSPRTYTVNQQWFAGSPGDQAGTPAAGSFLLLSFKATNHTNDTTPTAATTFTDNIVVDWIAIGL